MERVLEMIYTAGCKDTTWINKPLTSFKTQIDSKPNTMYNYEYKLI